VSARGGTARACSFMPIEIDLLGTLLMGEESIVGRIIRILILVVMVCGAAVALAGPAQAEFISWKGYEWYPDMDNSQGWLENGNFVFNGLGINADRYDGIGLATIWSGLPPDMSWVEATFQVPDLDTYAGLYASYQTAPDSYGAFLNIGAGTFKAILGPEAWTSFRRVNYYDPALDDMVIVDQTSSQIQARSPSETGQIVTVGIGRTDGGAIDFYWNGDFAGQLATYPGGYFTGIGLYGGLYEKEVVFTDFALSSTYEPDYPDGDATPEPASLVLMASALLGLVFWMRRRRNPA
jgi:hypothetical protein